MIRLLLILWLLPAAALAQSFPALHHVTGVASDDVLNIRAAPSAGAARIGAFEPGARDIEVIRTQGGWGLVNAGEGAGWVSMRFLRRQEAGDYALARRIACSGTEPFWSLAIDQGHSVRFSTMEGGAQSHPAGLLQRSANRSDRFALRAGPLVAVIARGACSDGMSDRAYGLSVDLLTDGQAPLRSGCCSLVTP